MEEGEATGSKGCSLKPPLSLPGRFADARRWQDGRGGNSGANSEATPFKKCDTRLGFLLTFDGLFMTMSGEQLQD